MSKRALINLLWGSTIIIFIARHCNLGWNMLIIWPIMIFNLIVNIYITSKLGNKIAQITNAIRTSLSILIASQFIFYLFQYDGGDGPMLRFTFGLSVSSYNQFPNLMLAADYIFWLSALAYIINLFFLIISLRKLAKRQTSLKETR